MNIHTLTRQSPASNRVVARAERELTEHGYALFGPSFADFGDAELAAARADFIASCALLPPDDYAATPGRFRRYGRYLLQPWRDDIAYVPPDWCARRQMQVASYLQPGAYNPEHADEARAFAALTDAQADNPFVTSIIQRIFAALAMPANVPVFVGVHIVRLTAYPGASAAMSPNCVHRDGEPYTAALLIDRDDVDGGENVFATLEMAGRAIETVPERSVFHRQTLTAPMEGWIVDDDKVSHYVSPITVRPGSRSGQRTMLLIDYTPAVPGR